LKYSASETKDNGGNAKMDEILEQVGLMMKKMINLETLIKNPLASIDMSIFLQFTASDYPVGMLNLLLRHVKINKLNKTFEILDKH
jgi:hypothetical protein